ncbi:3'(2'),5'-bisphosphate nucleotidase CysQ [Ancylobacter sp. A5.8]|uniref:3'(2'),5'-bisphosphate nucleotidase CysQ n=1 Tax=Ancylobacter gelatini TaxID=2919920 RepID=UPI001F4EC630|nr:3'(2'),5'-bisphosphate nucleotidase CysQ [Ancylobacter gelatini]MCJ8145280.1 3'(2'),5'-bisphosphate nucleotidase CysQ [Ancylobacter gelatini]
MTTDGTDRQDLLPFVELALRAGEVILDVYATDFVARAKADASPVTEADVGAEAVILEGLRRLAPGIPVVAEEEAAAGRLPAIGDVFFLVDPLDGTREFLARNGEFTVNIALVRGGVPVLGVVYAPALGVLYGGADGRAFKASVAGTSLGAIVPISVRPAAEPVAAIGSRSHGALAAAEWLARFPSCSFLSAGSSLKFCLVAEGAADVYPRLGRTMEWDTAAGDAVLRAAGGVVATLEGTPLAYGKRGQAHDVDFANPHFVAYGDTRLVKGAAVVDGKR